MGAFANYGKPTRPGWLFAAAAHAAAALFFRAAAAHAAAGLAVRAAAAHAAAAFRAAAAFGAAAAFRAAALLAAALAAFLFPLRHCVASFVDGGRGIPHP